MKMRINQLDEEIDEKTLKIELLTKTVDKYEQSKNANRVSVGSQTKEVKIIINNKINK